MTAKAYLEQIGWLDRQIDSKLVILSSLEANATRTTAATEGETVSHGLARWACPTFIQEGKSFCQSKKIPEEILMRISCDLFGWNSFDAGILHDTIDYITAVFPNELIFHLRDGTEQRTNWENESRSKSWTPEMRAKAAEAARRKSNGKKRHTDPAD